MHYKNLFPSKYLGAHDLRDRDVDVTIRAVVVEDIETERGKERRPCLYFEETRAKSKPGEDEKRLVMNRTNAKVIANIHGKETEGWKGKRITLFATVADAFGKQVECIRVRPNIPATTTTKTEITNGQD
jgi:acyl-coenzyme A synthetase/AMP-(fatty) acid ligase